MTGYQEIAEELVRLIDRRVLRAGDRVPSVRRATLSHHVNPGTVLRAYRDLEARGLIESRPRSGYFVRKPALRQLPEPSITTPSPGSTPIVVGDLIVELVKAINRPHSISLGLAILNPELLATDDLTRAALRTVRHLKPLRVVHDLPPGDKELRRRIALRYADSGCAVHDEEIVIMVSGREAVVLCLRALTSPGDTIAIETPSAWPQLGALAGLGLRVQEVPTDPREGVSLAALEHILQSKPVKACLVMPTFQNPLGSRMPDASKQLLARLGARYRIPIIENDIFGELYFDEARPRPVKAFDDSGYVLHCGSYGTCVASAFPIGWIAAGRYASEVMRTRILLSLSVPSVCQATMAEYLARGSAETNLRRVRRSLEIRRQAMIAAISEYFPEGCRMTHPTGGFVLWVELPKGTDSLELFRLAVAKGVSFAPGPMFSARREYVNFLRLNYGYASVPQIREGVRTIAQLIGRASL